MSKRILLKISGESLMGTSTYGIDVSTSLTPTHPYYGLPSNNGQFLSNPAGTIRLQLPSASVGLSFDVRSQQRFAHSSHTQFAPNLLVTPNNGEKFIFNVAGASGTIGKGVQIVSQSMRSNSRLHVTCQSGSDWSIININGPWTDEP